MRSIGCLSFETSFISMGFPGELSRTRFLQSSFEESLLAILSDPNQESIVSGLEFSAVRSSAGVSPRLERLAWARLARFHAGRFHEKPPIISASAQKSEQQEAGKEQQSDFLSFFRLPFRSPFGKARFLRRREIGFEKRFSDPNGFGTSSFLLSLPDSDGFSFCDRRGRNCGKRSLFFQGEGTVEPAAFGSARGGWASRGGGYAAESRKLFFRRFLFSGSQIGEVLFQSADVSVTVWKGGIGVEICRVGFG